MRAKPSSWLARDVLHWNSTLLQISLPSMATDVVSKLLAVGSAGPHASCQVGFAEGQSGVENFCLEYGEV